MSAKSVRKSECVLLDEASYAALIAFARLKGARSLSAAARLALRAALAEQTAPALRPPQPRRIRRLRLQLEPEMRAALTKRGLGVAEALQHFFSRA